MKHLNFLMNRMDYCSGESCPTTEIMHSWWKSSERPSPDLVCSLASQTVAAVCSLKLCQQIWASLYVRPTLVWKSTRKPFWLPLCFHIKASSFPFFWLNQTNHPILLLIVRHDSQTVANKKCCILFNQSPSCWQLI